MNRNFTVGFIKRASQYGLTEEQAVGLLKQAGDLDWDKIMAIINPKPKDVDHAGFTRIINALKGIDDKNIEYLHDGTINYKPGAGVFKGSRFNNSTPPDAPNYRSRMPDLN